MAARINPDGDYASLERSRYLLQQQVIAALPIRSKGGSSMQAVERNTGSLAPRVYRNRPHSFAFNSPRPEPLCDVVYLIDEDPRIRKEISTCFSTLAIKVTAFASATGYLNFSGRETAACLVLNPHLPDISGFDLQRRLAEKVNPPVIFISDHCDIA